MTPSSTPRAQHRRFRALASSAALTATVASLTGLAAIPATATTSTVTTPAQLIAAFGDGTVDEIVLGANITATPSTPSVSSGHSLTLDLAGHALSFYNLTVTPGSHLTIVDSAGGGTLTASPLAWAIDRAGITTSGATLEIQDGTVTASGWGHASGIGGDSTGRQAGTFLMSGGTVTANGGATSAGIGGSSGGVYDVGGSGGTITISGGTLNANGGSYSAGIGGSANTAAGVITISGGNVIATGGENGPGIGNGRTATHGVGADTASVQITGGTVDARGGLYGAPGIGGAYSAAGVALDVGADAVVTVTGSSGIHPLGRGAGEPGTWWGEYSIAGTLTLGSNYQIPAGASITVEEGGVITGPGLIKQNFVANWGGTVYNNGSIRTTVDAWTYVVGNDYTVTFSSNHSGASPETAPTRRVLAPSFTDAELALPEFPVASGALAWGWNTTASGSGTVFDTDTALSASLTVYADWRAFSGLTVTASEDEIIAGGSAGITVLGHEPVSGLSSDQTAYASYTSDVPSDVVTGNTILMTEAGVHTITASVSEVENTVEVTVIAGELARIEVDADNTALTAGDTVHFTVEGFDSYDNSLGDLTAQASFSPIAEAEAVDAAIVATRAGNHTVTATVDGISDSIEITVDPAALHRVEIDLPLIWTAGQPVEAIVTGYDSYGNSRGPLSISEIEVTSNGHGDSVEGLTLTGYHAGERLVQITVTELGMSYDYTVEVVAGTLARIGVPDVYTIAAGGRVSFEVVGWDSWENPIGRLDDSMDVSTDSPDAAVDDDGAVTFVRAGTPQVTIALAADPTLTTTFEVEVVAGLLSTIEVIPDVGEVSAGSSVSFSYRGADAHGNPIPLCGCTLALSSDEPSDVIDDNTVIVTRAGTRTITAIYPATLYTPERHGSVQLRVNPGAPISVTLHTSALTVAQNESLDFSVTGEDQYGNLIDAVAGVVLTSDQPTDIVEGLTVRFPHASPHVITARLGTLVSRMTIEVIPTPVPTPAPTATPTPSSTGATLVVTGSDLRDGLALGTGAMLLGLLALVFMRVSSRSRAPRISGHPRHGKSGARKASR